MKITYDKSVDAAYIYFSDDSAATNFGFTYVCNPIKVDGQINLDFDVSGRLTGIEVLNASEKLPVNFLRKNLKQK